MRPYPAETTEAYMDGMRRYLARYGRPVSFYSDKDSVFRINNEEVKHALGLTQVGRIVKTLNIELICANTPQAKGRIERSFQTHQDRLVKELRLAGISAMPAPTTKTSSRSPLETHENKLRASFVP